MTTAIDPLLLAAALKRLVGEVADVKAETERLDGVIGKALQSLAEGISDIVETSLADMKAENGRLRADNEELRKDIKYLQEFVAGHELALMGITGKPTEIVYPAEIDADPEPGIPLPSEQELKDVLRWHEHEQARANLG